MSISEVLAGDRDWYIAQGNSLELTTAMPEGSVHLVVTSPPYLGLRDYGLPPTDWPEVDYAPMPGLPALTVPAMSCCLGLEPSLESYTAHLVLVFRAVWRVLRDDGLLFLNVGDSYAGNGGAHKPHHANPGLSKSDSRGGVPCFHNKGMAVVRNAGAKPKDLLGIPWRVAFALEADGWHLHQWMPWIKYNSMPDSAGNRTGISCEFIFMLSKSGKTQFWTHPQLPGVRKRPKPDYVWVHRDTEEIVIARPDDSENWSRRNLWKGDDYYYDREAVYIPRRTNENTGMLGRSEGAIQRRILDLGLKERPLKADNHVKWTPDEYMRLEELIKHRLNYELMSDELGKSVKAIRGRVYSMYLTENLDRVAAMIGSGSWGDGRPERGITSRLLSASEREQVGENLSRLAGIIKALVCKHYSDADYWQRDLCTNWNDGCGCTAGEANCDSCTSFLRIRPQFCRRCGATFIKRRTADICDRYVTARKKQHQRKWAVLQSRRRGMQKTG